MTEWVWILIVTLRGKSHVNRVFTEEPDALKYEKDYKENTLFTIDLIKRKLHHSYKDWEHRQE